MPVLKREKIKSKEILNYSGDVEIAGNIEASASITVEGKLTVKGDVEDNVIINLITRFHHTGFFCNNNKFRDAPLVIDGKIGADVVFKSNGKSYYITGENSNLKINETLTSEPLNEYYFGPNF